MINFKSYVSGEDQPEYLFIAFSKDGKRAALKKALPRSLFVEWEDLSVVDGTILVKKELPLDVFSYLFIGTVGEHADLYSCLRAYIKSTKAKHLFYGSSPEVCNKVLQSVKMKALLVPQIKTVMSVAEKISASSLIKELGLPIVSKIVHGSQGKGVLKHDTKEDLEKFLKKSPEEMFIFQEFVPNDGDVRVFFIRDKLLYAISRKSAKSSEFRNNTSLGGDKQIIQLLPEAEDLARQAARSMKFDVTGVDLIQHRDTKQWYVMEINAAPQFGGELFKMVIDEIVSLVGE